ncbi:MAG TPA: DUF1592 domain-containing protein [Candidatus Acidoferrum sp.]|nr:DUF1592 domain-containing protein [Candidatus Acidoferrum sp.]
MRWLFWLALPVSCAFAQSPVESARTLTGQYCIGCHNQKNKTAGVSVDGIDWSKPGNSADTLEKVLRKVRSGEMPPPRLPRPSADASTAFTGWLTKSLDQAAQDQPNPGRPAIHRLNRAEYSNAIRDLLALDIKPGATLPVDDSGYGFDNIADVLSVSPGLLERYMLVARQISRQAVGDPAIKPVEEDYANERRGGGRGRYERPSDDLPFDAGTGMSFQHYFPLDAEYLIRVKLGTADNAVREVRIPVKAGLRTIGAAYLRESAKAEVAIPGGRRGAPAAAAAGAGRGGGGGAPSQLDLRMDGARLKLFTVPAGPGGAPQVQRVLVAGPYNVAGSGETASRARIFVCRPANAQEETPCARTILSGLARRAFRRPVSEGELKPLLAFYASGRGEGDFDHGIEKALRAVLSSPSFLFRIERDPARTAAGTVYRLNDYELASRLSFFLWSSIPDDELLGLADAGKLKDDAVLQKQVRRMLDDPRSHALVDNFAGQWLYLRNLAVARPDPDAFPDFDDSLRDAFQTETSLFFQNILREDRSVFELLDANYTYLNQRLAEHYGIPNVYGPQFRKVTLTDPNRGGLLGQGSILTVTSPPNRTSVVQRGKWILETLLGAPPPPPPPDIPDLKPHGKDGKLLSLREQMETHRANATCAACHSRMDPLGFALENYDGVGKWRVKDAGYPIDATGKLPNGTTFEGPAGLKKILLSQRREDFANTAVEKMFTYALGRGVEYYDMPTVRAISREAAKEDYRMSAIISAIVRSTSFQMRRSPEL